MAGRGAVECAAGVRRPAGMVVERCAHDLLDDTLLHSLAFLEFRSVYDLLGFGVGLHVMMAAWSVGALHVTMMVVITTMTATRGVWGVCDMGERRGEVSQRGCEESEEDIEDGDEAVGDDCCGVNGRRLISHLISSHFVPISFHAKYITFHTSHHTTRRPWTERSGSGSAP